MSEFDPKGGKEGKFQIGDLGRNIWTIVFPF